jgi:maltose alpha-D-glucosyltransferase/alpha-amylase
VRHCDPAWLASQRWFRSKQRRIADVTEIDRASLAGGAELTVIEVAYHDSAERYLVPVAGDHEPADGDGAWRALATLIAEGGELSGRRGRFVATPTPASPSMPAVDDLSERRLTVEQSNTSVVLGRSLILKLYRLLARGINPDVEVSVFLTRAGFADTPTVYGALDYRDETGEPSAAAMLQAFVPSLGDGWEATLAALDSDPEAAIAVAGEVGELTSSLHRALASRPDDPSFPARLATRDEAGEWLASAEHQLELAVAALTGAARRRLVALAPTIVSRLRAGLGDADHATPLSRIHGDYHLGQLLRKAEGGFAIIDFEGEPARPIEERRRPTSPLRDVAGMLRSFDYAARTAAHGHTDRFDPEHWLERARRALLEAYGAPAAGPDRQRLLDAFELEKACYEIHYEANNRPEWLWLPLAAVERLAAG